MAVIDLTERKLGLGAGVIAAGLMVSSAPGVAAREYKEFAQYRQWQPSGYRSIFDVSDNGLPVFESLIAYCDESIPTVASGSGGDSSVSVVIRVEHSGTARDDNRVTLDNSEVVAAIRSALSLQVKELASILGIQRPTVYSWINGESQPTAENRERLQAVYRLARRWNRLCRFPAEDLVRLPGADGKSVLELLNREEINEPAIIRRLERLAQERDKREARLNAKQPSVREVAHEHGIDLARVPDQQHVIDALTGKRNTLD